MVFTKMSKPREGNENILTRYQALPSYLYKDIEKVLGCLMSVG
jgi:hypothetical protein